MYHCRHFNYRKNGAVLTQNNLLQEFFHVFSCEFQKNRKLIIFSTGQAKKEFHQAGSSQTNLFFVWPGFYCTNQAHYYRISTSLRFTWRNYMAPGVLISYAILFFHTTKFYVALLHDFYRANQFNYYGISPPLNFTWHNYMILTLPISCVFQTAKFYMA